MACAGERNTKITIKKDYYIRNDYGEMVADWKNLCVVWAKFITSGGREFYKAQRINAETTAVFVIQYIRGLKTQYRITMQGRVFDILSIDNTNNQNKELVISAKEVV